MKVKALARSGLLIGAGVLGLSLLATGCTSLPEGSTQIKERALSFTPPEGKAGVYTFGRVPQVLVNIDAVPFGTVQSGYYLYGAVPPGEHTVAVLSGEGSSVGKFQAQSGSNYFFVVGGGWVGLKVTKQLSEEDGRKRVRKLKLSGDSHFEFDEDLKKGK